MVGSNRGWALGRMLAGLACGIWLAVAAPGVQAQTQPQAGAVIAFGPQTALLQPAGNWIANKTVSYDWTRKQGAQSRYQLEIDNDSPAQTGNKTSEVEVWHNGAKLLTTRDLFKPNGQPVGDVRKLLATRKQNELEIRLSGRALVRLTVRVVALPPPPPKIADLSPDTLQIKHGASGMLTARLEPVPAQAGTLTVATSADGTADAPRAVRYGAGQAQVAIPVYGESEGRARITATLNGASQGAWVQVNEAPARLVGITPLHSVLSQGVTAHYTLTIRPRHARHAHVIQLASSAPGVLSVPASVQAGAGQGSVSITARALAPGHAVITAQLNHGGKRSKASAHVQVMPAKAPTVTALRPVNTAVVQGGTALLSVTISAAQPRSTTVALLAHNAGVLQVPAGVVIGPGQTQGAFTVRGLQPGVSTVQANLNASTAQAAVQVSALPARLDSLSPGTSTLEVGAQALLRVALAAPVASSTTVALAAQPEGVVQLAASAVIPAGQQETQIPVTALAPGQARVSAVLNGVTRTASYSVTAQPPKVAGIEPQTVGVQAGASARLTVRLTSAPAEAVDVQLASSQPGVAQVPDSLSIEAGQDRAETNVVGVAAGQARITASLNGTSQGATVTVALPPPQVARITPAGQDLPRGKPGRLIVELDRAPQADTVVALAASPAGLVELPAQATVAAGELNAQVPLTAQQQGVAHITASLNGRTANAAVTVTAAQLAAIQLQPAAVQISPGQTMPLRAMGTYSDGSTRDITHDAATQWRVTPTSPQDDSDTVADITPDGQLMGLDSGQAIVSAAQDISATWGEPEPAPVVGEGTVTVGEASPLALAAASVNLVAGQTTTVSIGAPYPAAARAITVTLTTSGALQAPAQILIGPGLTSVNVLVQATAAGEATLRAAAAPFAPGQLAFVVTEPAPTSVRIDAISPTSAPPGANVTLTGSGFATPPGANTVVFHGNVPAVVQGGSATQLSVKVPDTAQSGPITVANALGSGQSEHFTVIREQDIGLAASPAYLRVMQGSNAIAVLNVASSGTRAWQGLARLSVTGVPAGVTARFEPATLSAYQTGKLILEAADSAPLATASLTVRAEATLDGLPWVREGRITAQTIARAGVTGVKGRFITPTGAGIAGVIVRLDTTTQQVVSDAAGNFLLTGLPAGVTTLRFDATPANSLYPIWPYNVTLQAGELLTAPDWIINPPPPDDQFKPISNAAQDQQITDERYPGFAVTLPAGVNIVGYDGVKKTRIAVQRIEPDKLPVGAPPIPMKEAYQLYFGTPMGGIPSAPIPVTLPNVAEREPGDKVEIWWFDGSPMGGTGDWKLAGLGTVSPDGKTVASDAGVGLPRFCGVCGLVCLNSSKAPGSVQGPPTCDAAQGGNPVDLYTGQEMAGTSGLSCGGRTPLDTGMKYNPVDPFNNVAGVIASFGFGWTSDYDASFLPFSGVQKRLVMPGGQFVNLVDDGTGKYRPVGDPRHDGSYAQQVGDKQWEMVHKGGARWLMAGTVAEVPGERPVRGGSPLFLSKVTDANGNETHISRRADGRILGIGGADGRSLAMTYNSQGLVSRVTDHTGRTQDYDYTPEGRVNKITDAQGRQTHYDYQRLPTYLNSWHAGSSSIVITACEAELPGNHRGITSIKYPESDTPTVNTYGTDRILKQVTSTGEEWKFSYKRAGACVAKIMDPPAQVSGVGYSTRTEYEYTCRAGQPLSKRVCTGNGATAQCTDVVTGTCPDVDSEESRAAGWRFYGGVNLETTVTKPDGQKQVWRFNPRGMPLEEIDEQGQSTRYSYDANQRHIKTQDPLGRETRHEYDARGNRTASIDPLGRRQDTAWDSALNKPTQHTSYLLGVPSTQGGQQLSYTPVNQTIAYDAKGNVTSTTDPTGVASHIRYDSAGQIGTLTLPALGSAVNVPVVNAGTPGTIPKASRQLSLAYNAAGDIAAIKDAQGNETKFTTDALGRTTGQVDPLGYASTTQYNALDQLTQARDALNQTSSLNYDAAARLTGAVNQAGVTIEGYGYDAQGRVTRVTDALGQNTSIRYDSSGRVDQVTDRKGQTTSITYDARGQISQISKPGQSISYQYDAVGRLTEVRDATTVSTHQYDNADRLVQIDTTTSAGTHRLSYEYDSLDRVKQRTLSGTGIATPETTTYEWDLAGRLLSHSTTIGGQPHTTSYQYDAAGRLAARKVQAGSTQDLITQRYGYDTAERLAQIKYIKAEGTGAEQLIEQIDYGYDAKGQRTSKTTLNNNGAGVNETPMTASYDAANRMTGLNLVVAGQTKTYSLSYDTNGNLTQKQNAQDGADTTTYTWDANDRLTGLTQPGLTANFSYDVFGRRIQSTITRQGQSPATVQYLYEGSQALGEIRDGRLSHRLLTGLSLDETIARVAVNAAGQKDPTASRIYITDALNSVIAQLNDDNSANIANSYGYSPYGESQTVGPDATNNPIQYTSRENDGTGLYYYRARYYHPFSKVMLSEDPAGFEAGLNKRSYVNNAPTNYSDPEGEVPAALLFAYGRCVAQCMAQRAAGEALFGDIECFDVMDNAKDCALDCLNPMSWAGKAGMSASFNRKRNISVWFPSKKKAKDAARNKGGDGEMHRTDKYGKEGHYHDGDHDKAHKDNIHYRWGKKRRR